MKLEHLAPYLPYGLKVEYNNYRKDIAILKAVHYNKNPNPKKTLLTIRQLNLNYNISCFINSVKPILRPLSDLTRDEYFKLSQKDDKKEFGYWYVKSNATQKKGIHFEGYSSRRISLSRYDLMPYYVLEFLFKNHFDVFELIEEGLAINYNDIKL